MPNKTTPIKSISCDFYMHFLSVIVSSPSSSIQMCLFLHYGIIRVYFFLFDFLCSCKIVILSDVSYSRKRTVGLLLSLCCYSADHKHFLLKIWCTLWLSTTMDLKMGKLTNNKVSLMHQLQVRYCLCSHCQ